MAVKLDAFEFGQMMLNLALNAQDAMPSGGTLTIGTASEIEPQEAIYIRGNYPSRKCYCVTIADYGHGIEEDKIQSIFDPFFTTKFRNKGSGLGLYNCQHILERHQGAIGVQSKKGRGTTSTYGFPKPISPKPTDPILTSDSTKPFGLWARC